MTKKKKKKKIVLDSYLFFFVMVNEHDISPLKKVFILFFISIFFQFLGERREDGDRDSRKEDEERKYKKIREGKA